MSNLTKSEVIYEIAKDLHNLGTIDDVTLGEYVPFVLEDYLDNPVALARIKAHLTQEALAAEMKVSQTYISRLEVQEKFSPKTLEKVNHAIERLNKVSKGD